jgi:hypothetical protein
MHYLHTNQWSVKDPVLALHNKLEIVYVIPVHLVGR